MIFTLAALVFIILFVISLIHIYWGFGGVWPARDGLALSRMVIGVETTSPPPGFVTFVVAGMIFIAGYLPMAWLNVFPWPVSQTVLYIMMISGGLVFLLRGLVAYTPLMKKYSTVEPFTSLNKKYYSPLCLFIGVSIFVILFS